MARHVGPFRRVVQYPYYIAGSRAKHTLLECGHVVRKHKYLNPATRACPQCAERREARVTNGELNIPPGTRAIWLGTRTQAERYTLVDAEDFEQLSKYQWTLRNRGGGTLLEYAWRCATPAERAAGAPNTILMHRQILQPPSDLVIDHINHDGLDNRRQNLRIVTQKENMANKRKSGRKPRGIFLVAGKPRDQLLALFEYEQEEGHPASGKMLNSTYSLLSRGLVERGPSDSCSVYLTELGRQKAKELWDKGIRTEGSE